VALKIPTGGEYARVFARDRGIARDDDVAKSADRFDHEGARRHVDENRHDRCGGSGIASSAYDAGLRRGRDAPLPRRVDQCSGLHGGADGDDLVRVDSVHYGHAEIGFDASLDDGHPRRSAHEHDLVEGRRRQVRQMKGLLCDCERALDERAHEGVEVRLGHRKA
jgi:hypothetical protein